MGQVRELPNRKKGFIPSQEGLGAVKSIAHGQPLKTLDDIFSEQHLTLFVSRWIEDILTTNEKDRTLSTISAPDLPLGLTLGLANRHLSRLVELVQHINGNFRSEK